MRSIVPLGRFVGRQLLRRPARTVMTGLGIAVAAILLVCVCAMDWGVREATGASQANTRLIVYRANRFCPFTSQLPQHYTSRIAAIPGVESVLPMKIVVSNCRASLDVVAFRGVPEESIPDGRVAGFRLTSGSLEEWSRRGDAAIVGSALAARRGIAIGDRFSAAGVTVYVVGIAESDEAQDRNAAWVHLAFLQEAVHRGGSGGIVTQFAVEVADPARLDAVASAIDAEFARDSAPTTTTAERAFVARAAADIVEISRFARWLGLGALVAVFALVANAIALALADRVRDIAVLQTLGFRPALVTGLVVAEGAMLGFAGGAVGALLAWAILRVGRFSLTTEGVNIEIASGIGVAALGIALTTALGAAASLLPAVRAARREIVASFRTT